MAVKWKTESARIIIEKGTEVQNNPKTPNSKTCRIFVTEVFVSCWSPVMFDGICITPACAAVSHLWRTHCVEMSEGFYFIATEAWSLSSLLWSFSMWGNCAGQLRKPMFLILNYFSRRQIRDLYSSQECQIPTRVSKIHGAGYLICKWDW